MKQMDLPLSASVADYRMAMLRAMAGDSPALFADAGPIEVLRGLLDSGVLGLRAEPYSLECAEQSPLDVRVQMLEGELRGRRLIDALRGDDEGPLQLALQAIDHLLDRVADLRSQVDELSYPAREKIKTSTKRLLRRVIHTYYDGNCACCFTVLILKNGDQTAEYQIDHWVSRDDNRPCSLWSVCSTCNRELGPANSPQRRDPDIAARFDAFQAHLKELLNRQQQLTL